MLVVSSYDMSKPTQSLSLSMFFVLCCPVLALTTKTTLVSKSPLSLLSVKTVCQDSYNHLHQLRLVVRSLSVHATKNCPGIHLLSSGLLQSCTVQHRWWVTLPPAVSTECGSTVGHQHSSVWPHLTTATATELTSSMSVSQVQALLEDCCTVISWSCISVPRRCSRM